MLVTLKNPQLNVKRYFLDFVFLFFTDERDRVQKKTFTKWINQHLMKVRTCATFPCFCL